MLGNSLVGQGKYAEAEPLLISGYEAMIERQTTMSASDKSDLQDAGQRIVQLYQNWGKPAKIAEWKQRLQASTPASNPK